MDCGKRSITLPIPLACIIYDCTQLCRANFREARLREAPHDEMAERSDFRLVRLAPTALVGLLKKLESGLPRTSGLRSSAKNVLEGRVEGTFYTDGWPEFTTVVFEILQPRFSDICDLYCYTTSKPHLVRLLEQAHLVTVGRWQFLQIIEDDDRTMTDYLIQNLQPDGDARLSPGDYSVYECGMYALLGQLPTTSAKCPVGYRLGELVAEHSTLVSSQAEMWTASIGRPVSVVEEYHKQCIQRLDSAAVFLDSDFSTPVAWQMQHGISGELGNLFTIEEHRRKGLATAVKRAVCQKILARGDIPISSVHDDSPSVNLQRKLGFQQVCRVTEVYLYC